MKCERQLELFRDNLLVVLFDNGICVCRVNTTRSGSADIVMQMIMSESKERAVWAKQQRTVSPGCGMGIGQP